MPTPLKNKNLYKRCLCALVVLMLCASPLAALGESYMVVRGGALNLRETASTDAKVLGQYATGTWVTVLESGATWSKVSVGGKTGYMMSKYLSDGSSSTTLYVRTNTGRGLNLRNAPGLTGDIITSYKPGTAVTLLAKGNRWYKVSVGGNTGYMDSTYLRASQSTGGSTGSAGSGSSVKLIGTVNNPKSTQVLNLRETPSLNARVLAYYKNGKQVSIWAEKDGWYEVTVDGKHGYMLKQYVSLTSNPVEPFEASLKNINGGSVVNFRREPGMNTSIIKAYPVGTKVTVLDVGVNWSKVEINGTQGYVSTYFLKY